MTRNKDEFFRKSTGKIIDFIKEKEIAGLQNEELISDVLLMREFFTIRDARYYILGEKLAKNFENIIYSAGMCWSASYVLSQKYGFDLKKISSSAWPNGPHIFNKQGLYNIDITSDQYHFRGVYLIPYGIGRPIDAEDFIQINQSPLRLAELAGIEISK